MLLFLDEVRGVAFELEVAAFFSILSRSHWCHNMILSNGSSGMYIQEAITTRCIYRFLQVCFYKYQVFKICIYRYKVLQVCIYRYQFFRYVYTGIRYSRYVYKGISSSGKYIQVSRLQVCIYRYQVFKYVYTGSGLQYVYTESRSRKDVFTDFYRYVYTGIRSKGMY